MNGYLISTIDRPGLAAGLFEAAAARGVNVVPAYGISDGTKAMLLVGSDDEAGLQAAIADAGLAATPIEMFVTELDNVVGAGADLFHRLAEAGVDLRIAVPVGMNGERVQFGLGGSDPEALKRFLGG